MKKFPFILAVVACMLALMPACSDSGNGLSSIEEWLNDNNAWLIEQQNRTNPDGTPYFNTVVPSWNPGAYVLIHYFNDRSLTAGNLSPMLTSTVDTRYKLTLYNDEAMDSSYNLTVNGPGIFRTKPSDVIVGWTIALQDMRVGDTAEVVIPYEWAYGTTGSSSIPAYSNLKFNMKLVDIHTYEINPE